MIVGADSAIQTRHITAVKKNLLAQLKHEHERQQLAEVSASNCLASTSALTSCLNLWKESVMSVVRKSVYSISDEASSSAVTSLIVSMLTNYRTALQRCVYAC